MNNLLLRSRREELGLTLKEVGKACGVSEATVSRWETGDISTMKRENIAKLSEVLGLSPSLVAGWETVKVENEKGNIKEFILNSNELELVRKARKMPYSIEHLLAYMDLMKEYNEKNEH